MATEGNISPGKLILLRRHMASPRVDKLTAYIIMTQYALEATRPNVIFPVMVELKVQASRISPAVIHGIEGNDQFYEIPQALSCDQGKICTVAYEDPVYL